MVETIEEKLESVPVNAKANPPITIVIGGESFPFKEPKKRDASVMLSKALKIPPKHGIDITGGDHWIIRDNAIHDNAVNRLSGTKANGIMLKAHNVGTLVERNRIHSLESRFGAITLGGETVPSPEVEGAELLDGVDAE